jgi:hypothetical protein
MAGATSDLFSARLLQRKVELMRRYSIPDSVLPGSIALSHLRCGKPSCRCANRPEARHPFWTYTFMVDGKKHTQHIAKEMLEEVRTRVLAGREFQDAVREVLSINAQLLVLTRRQQLQRRPSQK